MHLKMCQRYRLIGVYGTSKLPNDFKHDLYCSPPPIFRPSYGLAVMVYGCLTLAWWRCQFGLSSYRQFLGAPKLAGLTIFAREIHMYLHFRKWGSRNCLLKINRFSKCVDTQDHKIASLLSDNRKKNQAKLMGPRNSRARLECQLLY